MLYSRISVHKYSFVNAVLCLDTRSKRIQTKQYICEKGSPFYENIQTERSDVSFLKRIKKCTLLESLCCSHTHTLILLSENVFFTRLSYFYRRMSSLHDSHTSIGECLLYTTLILLSENVFFTRLSYFYRRMSSLHDSHLRKTFLEIH